jgi:hypothetical protein
MRSVAARIKARATLHADFARFPTHPRDGITIAQ